MKEIRLTKGKVALVDNEDFERLNKFKWYAQLSRKNWYARRGFHIDGKLIITSMHRDILNVTKGIHVDHINGNSLDNRKENIRKCIIQQNRFNVRGARKDNKLGIKGVYWRKEINKFQARIGINGKRIDLGHYNVLGDADSAYRIAEEKYFGEFSRKVG